MSEYRSEHSISKIIIHCSNTPNGSEFTADDIDGWHKKRNITRSDAFIGVNDYTHKHIGYHIVIDIEGNRCDTRKLDETGNHSKGHNKNSIGLCMIGTDRFTEDQWMALKHTVESITNRFQDIEIMGHNDISKRLCPGFDVQQWLSNNMMPEANRIFKK